MQSICSPGSPELRDGDGRAFLGMATVDSLGWVGLDDEASCSGNGRCGHHRGEA